MPATVPAVTGPIARVGRVGYSSSVFDGLGSAVGWEGDGWGRGGGFGLCSAFGVGHCWTTSLSLPILLATHMAMRTLAAPGFNTARRSTLGQGQTSTSSSTSGGQAGDSKGRRATLAPTRWSKDTPGAKGEGSGDGALGAADTLTASAGAYQCFGQAWVYHSTGAEGLHTKQ